MNLIIETPRLIIRPFEKSDAQELFDMDKNPNVHKYLWLKPVESINEVYDYIEMVQKQYYERGIGRFSTILKETGELIGWTGIKFVNDHIENGNTNFYDYGYRLNEKFWNKGYASEATKA
jgi:RimJ/RimL family protein N-acetyltransferase